MTRMGDQALLDLWERLEGAAPVLRPAELLDGLRVWIGDAAAQPAATLPVGQRDRALIDLRARLFGPDMHCSTVCDHCGARIDLAFDLTALPSAPPESPARIAIGESALRLRLPSTDDLAYVLGLAATIRPAALIRRCALDPLPDPLPLALIEAASEAVAGADPDAEIELATACPECGTAQAVIFDIGLCLWDDLTRAARRLIREVHHLARAYGWTEAEVLAIPRRRRLEYLLVGSN